MQSTDDNRFTCAERILIQSSFDDVEDNAWSVSANLGKFVDALSTMEPEDINKITNTVRKYEVKGTQLWCIRRKNVWLYDLSQELTKRLIRRRRAELRRNRETFKYPKYYGNNNE